MSPKNYYLVRSSRSIPLQDGVIGVGWDDMEFQKYPNAEELLKAMAQAGWLIGRNANQIRRFKSICKGDLVIVPYWNSIAVGVATGEEHWDSKYSQNNGANQHRVEFLKDASGIVQLIPRGDLSEALQRRTKIRITIANIAEFHAELESLVENLASGKAHSFVAEIERREVDLENTVKEQLLNHIRTGKTGLASGGVGLEQLVAELLRIDGFTADVFSKRAFPGGGDADIKASKTDMLRQDEFLIQVKHHHGSTGLWGQQQLMEIKKLLPMEYEGFQLVLVTSGDVSDEDRENAKDNDITIFDGSDLADWVLTSIDKLKLDTRRKLRISDVPRIID